MEPTSSMFESIMYPTGLYQTGPLRDPGLDLTDACSESELHERSQTNPKNRINSLELPKGIHMQWRIDDADADGTRFFAVPEFALGKPPLRVDVYIPDQLHHPPGLRGVLESHRAMLVGGRKLANLGVSRLVLQRLHLWSTTSTPAEIQSTYFSLPFGSRIVLDAISADVSKIPLHIIPNYDIERQWLTVDELQSLWRLAPEQWPPTLDHDALQLQHQIHEAISVVRLAHLPPSAPTYVFKSVSSDVKYLYHEMRALLTMPPHRHVISKPLYIVTKRCLFGGRVGVCGFILPFYPLGTLRDALYHNDDTTIRFPLLTRLRWARQIVSALSHIRHRSPAGFYTDLKPNNILLVQGAHPEDTLDTLLVDFEQRGSWYSWSPPEIYRLEYLEMLASSPLTPPAARASYAATLRSLLPTWTPHRRRARYDATTPPPRGYSQAWNSLSSTEAEAAQVFMVGKLLWCVLEGVGFPGGCVTVETFREVPVDLAFPDFRRAPGPLRELVKRCTAGASEWAGRKPGVVRVGDRLFARGRTGRDGEVEGTAAETQEAAREWWREEVAEAERFIAAKVRRRDKCEEEEDAEVLGFLGQRPSLAEVEAILRDTEEELKSQVGI
ncbi:hypothetical protein QBC39DRAFT_255371 [Podospora conica]|nr:hypothetical protein QBC39DRAFT_255371 [Schizothecium conicum]